MEPQVPLSKVPPHSVEAEKATLGSLLIDPEAIIKIADFLAAEDFYYENHREIFKAMLDLYSKRMPLDLKILTAYLEDHAKLSTIGGASYLTELTLELPTATHVVQYALIVKQKSTLRKLIAAGDKITALGYAEAGELEVLLEEAEKALFSVSQTFVRDRFVHIKEILSQTYEKISDIHDSDAKERYRGLPTGFRSLDYILSGLQSTDLVIIAARPAMGKTAFALNIAQNVARRGKTVGIISLEMSKEQLVERMLCSLLGVDSWKMKTGNLSQEDFSRMGAVMDDMNQTNIFVDDSSGSSIVELRTKARRLKAQHGLDLLVVDYLQMMSVGRPGYQINRVQEVSEISRSLKNLAREMRIPLIAISQLSRAVENRPSKIPQLSDLRESGCLAGDTLIMRADSGDLVPIKNLVGQTDIPVYSLNNQMQMEVKKISKVFSSGVKRLFELKTRSGRVIKASANHPFFTIDGWRALDKLSQGTRVALPRQILAKSPRSKLSNLKLILLAHLIGDGCVLPDQGVHYTSSDQENIEVVGNAARWLFGIIPQIIPQKNWFHVYLSSPYRLTHGRHNPIVDWFRRMGLKLVHSFEKVLPDSLFACSQEQIRLFLHHLWATDGNISWKILEGRKPAAAIYYSTASPNLAVQIQHLLLRLGIQSTRRVVHQGIYRPSHQIHIQGSLAQLRFCEQVGSYGARGKIVPKIMQALREIESNPNCDVIPREAWDVWIKPEKKLAGFGWRDVSEKIQTSYCGSALFQSGLSRERMERVAVALKSKPLLQLAVSDIYWDEIVSITPLGEEEVFDATVPGTHNFVANDFIVHNSIEQEADMVLMMYREDYYEEDTDRKGITDIYIRKHRNGPTGHIELMFEKEKMRFLDIERERTIA